MKVICFECGEQIAEKAPFSDNQASHALCEPCLTKVLKKLREERRRKKGRYHHDMTSTS